MEGREKGETNLAPVVAPGNQARAQPLISRLEQSIVVIIPAQYLYTNTLWLPSLSLFSYISLSPPGAKTRPGGVNVLNYADIPASPFATSAMSAVFALSHDMLPFLSLST